jgi:glycosyltransferase involved in cell wall biosynthesis
MSLRIAILGACPYPVPQGSQVFLRDTALALRRRGHDVHVVVYGYGDGVDASGLRVHRSMRIPFVRRTKAGPSLFKPILDFALLTTLRRVIREHRIEVVQAHNYEGLLVALAAGARPIVYQAHNAMADELPHYLGFRLLGRRIGRWLDRTFPRRAAHAIAPHPHLAQYLISCGCAPARVSVAPPPAVVDWVERGTAEGTAPPVLYTGNLDAYQNLSFLRRVMERVREIAPECQFEVATRDPVRFDGAVVVETPDFATTREVLSRDAVVVCPRVSWSGYPIKLLNAMAAGKAVVACRSAAHPLEHGRTGLVVDDNDEEAFAAAVVCLMRDPSLRARLGEAAREAVRIRHCPERFAETLESICIDAIGAAHMVMRAPMLVTPGLAAESETSGPEC